jgi:hypothetical protein
MLNRKLQAAAGTAAVAMVAGLASGGSAEAASTPQGGWVRLAHLSPHTPPVDVYLYAFGGTSAQIVLHHVAYGVASPYEPLPQGLYTVAMRLADADPASAPVISTNVDVKSGAAYTVAGLGPSTGLTLNVLSDRLGAPAGKAEVRVIEASLQNPAVTVSTTGSMIAGGLHFPTVSDYQTVAAGSWDVTVKTDAASTTWPVSLHAGSTYTLAILDGTGSSPKVLNLSDSAAATLVPKGGVAAGLGATAADHGPFGALEAEMLWGGLLIAGATGVVFSVRRLRRF